MEPVTANTAEVIQVDGPDHGTAEASGAHVIHLDGDGVFSVVADPLVALGDVGTAHRVAALGPTALDQVDADFVVGQEAGFFGEGSLTPWSADGRSGLVVDAVG